MSITNQSKPTTSFSNSSKVSVGETWASITTTWATETRTWLAASQLFVNQNKATNVGIWSALFYPWLDDEPWILGEPSEITNVSKPS